MAAEEVARRRRRWRGGEDRDPRVQGEGSLASRRGALAFCERKQRGPRKSPGEALNSATQGGSPMSRRGALAFCKRKRRRRGAQQRGTGRVAIVEKRRIGILQTGAARVPRSTARHEVGKVGEEGLATQGNLDSTNHAQQGIQVFARAKITVSEQGGKSFEMGVEKLEPRARRKVLNLRSDIALARNLKERSNARERMQKKNREFSERRAEDST